MMFSKHFNQSGDLIRSRKHVLFLNNFRVPGVTEQHRAPMYWAPAEPLL